MKSTINQKRLRRLKPSPCSRIGARINYPTPQSYWWHSVRSLFFSLQEIPLAALTAGSAIIGTGMLLSYFELIGFTPDVSTLISLSVAAALATTLFFLAIIFTMQAPVWLVPAYGLPLLSPIETFSAQVMSFSMLATWVAWSQPRPNGWLIILFMGVFSISAVALFSRIGVSSKNSGLSSLSALVIALGSFLTAYVLLVLIVVGAVDPKLPEWKIWAGLVSALLIVSFINCLSTQKKESWKGASVLLSVTLSVSLILITPKGFISTTIATILGLKMKGDVILRVSRPVCVDILTTTALTFLDLEKSEKEEAPIEICRDFGNRLTAQVDLRWGNRWLLQVIDINGTSISPLAPKITIPDSGTEIVLPSKKEKS